MLLHECGYAFAHAIVYIRTQLSWCSVHFARHTCTNVPTHHKRATSNLLSLFSFRSFNGVKSASSWHFSETYTVGVFACVRLRMQECVLKCAYQRTRTTLSSTELQTDCACAVCFKASTVRYSKRLDHSSEAGKELNGV